MKNFPDSLASWATLLAALVSLIGLIQSQTWLVGIGAFCVGGLFVALAHARKERRILKSAAIRIEGRSIDSLNIANLQRHVNQSLLIQTVHRAIEIDGEDLRISARYSGYCRADQETSIEFSVDSDNNVPFEELDCFGYDLGHDPKKKHRIHPVLVGSDGNSKKMVIPFLAPLKAEQPFDIALHCNLPGCMKLGVEYYTSTLSFDQDTVRRCQVTLEFIGQRPDWVRVYECDASGRASLLQDLIPEAAYKPSIRYVDNAENVSARSTRIYLFHR